MKTKIFYGPPGTGKTTRLIETITKELEDGVEPERLAYVSFTRAAINEARERVTDAFRLNASHTGSGWNFRHFRTLHATCYHALGLQDHQVMRGADYQELGQALGVDVKGSGVADSSDWAGATEGDRYLFIYQLARARRVSIEDLFFDEPDLDWFALRQFVEGYMAFKHERGLLDFTDMLETALRREPLIGIDAVIIDEAQDLSALQWAVVRHLFKNCKRLYAAGDDDQAIYEWSGADPFGMTALPGAESTVLDVSYRLPKSVATCARSVIRLIDDRVSKGYTCDKTTDQAVEHLVYPDEVHLTDGKSWLLLARNRFLLEGLEELCREQGVYYSTSGKPSVKPRHLEAMVTWTHLRKGRAVSVAAARHALQFMGEAISITRAGVDLQDDAPIDLVAIERLLGVSLKGDWYDMFKELPLTEREYYAGLIRSGANLLTKPLVRVSTIHGAKGAEADNVLVLTDLAYKTWEFYQDHADPEHRVFYVACTRARERLFICHPQTNYYYEGFNI